MSQQKVVMGVHAGNALKYITDNYPTLSKVILELVQNSLDSDANEIYISVDYNQRSIYVRDNGSGISPAQFSEAISLVCKSNKTDRGKLGQFGIGMLSPLGKCKYFIITSAPAQSKYSRWTFNSQEILESSEFSEILRQDAPEILFSLTGRAGPNKKPVPWRTEVRLYGFSKDNSINAVGLEDLRSLILGQFSEAMKRLNVTIHLRIKRSDKKVEELNFQAAQFKGQKLEAVAYGDKMSGQTTFELYVSPKTKAGRRGVVIFGVKGNDFRIPMSVFRRSIEGIANSETVNVLASGFFEGQILSSACTLHQNRKEFREDEALVEFCIHLDSWVENHGQQHIIAAKDSTRDVWLQAIGQVAIKNLEEKLRAEMPHLLNVVKTFKVGNIGAGHNGFDFAGKEQGFKTKDTNQVGGGGKSSPKAKTPKLPDSDHPEHMPFSVSGPKGGRRRLVRGHSTGVQFCYEEMPGNDHHWEFEEETGILTFNMRSDLWAKMEANERNLILYQEYIAVKALEMCLEPPATRQAIFEFLQRELRTAVILIMSSSALHPRKAKAEVGRRIS
ncbi:MAG: ATP-binding protein [Patescibacteria group bacterium]